jgi:penicillin amidase
MGRALARILLAVLALLLVIGVAAAAVRYLLIPRSFPQVEGQLRLRGLDGPVDVYRDSLGIPHVYASTEHDLYLAQGYVHAQDRFWQMEFWRRIGSGRLSEVLGEATLEQDKFIRTVGWHRTAAQELERMGEADRAVLDAYAAGVNAYLERSAGKLGLEFTILGLTGADYQPEPWTPLNTLTWAKVMAWDLGGNRSDELVRAQMAARLGTPAIQVLMPDYDPSYPLILPAFASEPSLRAVPQAAYSAFAFGSGAEIGSNNWVVAGRRTVTGAPLLANDPHLSIQMPSIWYEIGLHCDPQGPECPLNLVGASFAGVPGVVIGHNDRIAWGVTNLGPDVQDLFIERVNPENPNQYEFAGQWRDMELIREEIAVSGRAEPVLITVRKTLHGPIINDVAGGIGAEWDFGWQPLSFAWTALQPGTLVESLRLLNRAQHWDEFRQALALWDVPSQNFVYADVEGNLGYQAPGRIPIRAAGDGSMPVPGWTGQYEWVSFIPFDDLPRSFNPPEGFIATANNAVVGPDYPYFLSMDWDPGYRARRLVELLQADDTVSLLDIQAFQRDSSPQYAQDVLHFYLALQPEDNRLAQALDLLRTWDGRAVRDSAGAALFEALRIQLVRVTFEDELGEALVEAAQGSLQVAAARLLSEPDSPWFDDRRTEQVEGRDQALQAALQRAVDELSELLGQDMGGWRWGELHTASFENQSLGQSGIWPIERLFNRGPVEADGSIGTLNNTAYDPKEGFAVDTVPSYRQVIDLQDFSRSASIHTTGQSGHPFHPHYDDMIEAWRNFQYHPMLWTRSQVEAAAEAHLRFIP